MKNAANGMVCKKCITKEIEDERQQSIEIISKHLAKKNTKCQSKAEYINEFTALLNKNASRHCKISTRDKMVGLGSCTGFHCAHDHHFQLSPNLTHPDSNGQSFMHYDVNAKAIIQGT